MGKASVYFYYANIIDYFRLICLLVSFSVYSTHPILFVFLYFTSFVLDLFDGLVARKFNQCSTFGSALDMIIDRLSTGSLLVILSSFYKEYFILFLLLLLLDVGSHWLQIYSSLLFMAKNKDIINHKQLNEEFYLLGLYYNNQLCLGICCLGAELLLIFLYLNFFYHFTSIVTSFLFYLCLVIYAYKQFMSILQIISASKRIVTIDEENRKPNLD
jgi:CDP-diacylglycerol--inositol 3-phosphatidyltransferase